VDFREEHSRRIDGSISQVQAALLAITPKELPLSCVMLALRLAPARHRCPTAGKFWHVREEVEPIADAEAFARFEEPGFAKGAMNFRIVEEGDAARLTTETRVQATDDRTRRSFRPYWIPVRAIGGLMRLEILRAVALRVKRSSETVSC
jgi:hypothetical protein